MKISRAADPRAGRAGTTLPAWPSALVVIAHPDDESFGLGAVIDRLTAAGAAVHILCYTHGGASTLNQTRADLHRAREAELRQAAAELGAAGITLLDYPLASGRYPGGSARGTTSQLPPPAATQAACSSSTTPG